MGPPLYLRCHWPKRRYAAHDCNFAQNIRCTVPNLVDWCLEFWTPCWVMKNRYAFMKWQTGHNCAPMQYCLTPARVFLSVHLPVVPNPYAMHLSTIQVHKIYNSVSEVFFFILPLWSNGYITMRWSKYLILSFLFGSVRVFSSCLSCTFSFALTSFKKEYAWWNAWKTKISKDIILWKWGKKKTVLYHLVFNEQIE